MTDYTSPVVARNDLMDYLYDRDEALPDDVREGLLANLKSVSPVVCVVESVTLVIDRQPDCPPGLIEWAASAALLCAAFGLGSIDGDAVAVLQS